MKIPVSPPMFDELFRSINPEDLPKLLTLGPLSKGRYLHWDEVRHRSPPEGLTHHAWWGGLKLARMALLKNLPLQDKRGNPIKVGTPPPVLRSLHTIDRQASGTVEMSVPIVSVDDRDRYLVNSLIEEAITSSQLEGAATTREEAKAMLRSGRKPRDRSEKMILNNFFVMEHIREISDRPLTPGMVLEMHRIVTQDTMEDPSTAGRLRLAGEKIQVVDSQHSLVLHDPPDAATLPNRLDALCAFANAENGEENFIHPVTRAVLLHFMIGYDHPFVDGNGRTARALFYWSMARAGYWLVEYISISRLLRKAPAKYGRAYLYTETDENDATYFLIHQLNTIERAIGALHEYLQRKASQQRATESLLHHAPTVSDRLNHRQVALVSHALRHHQHGYTVESHRRSHRVSTQTARTDLMGLARMGFLEKRKRGRAFVFFSPSDLHERIEAMSKRINLAAPTATNIE